MNQDKWKAFEMSGRIEDYLKYKGLTGYNNNESGNINADNSMRNSNTGEECRRNS